MIYSLNDFALSPTNFNATIIRNVLPYKKNSALYLTLDGQSNAVSSFFRKYMSSITGRKQRKLNGTVVIGEFKKRKEKDRSYILTSSP